MKNRMFAFEDKLAATNPSQIVLSGMDITDEEIPDLLQLINRKQNINLINLSNNKITSKGAILIANECRGLKSLQVIDLQSNNIDVEGAKALWELRDSIPGLMIGLHDNKVTYEDEYNVMANRK